MGKKDKSKQIYVSDVQPIVELQFEDPLFALAAHPSKPLLLAGLGTGHVSLHKYNDSKLQEILEKNIETLLTTEELDTTSKANGKKHKQKKKKLWSVVKAYGDDDDDDDELVETIWKTKRHKSSCRIVLMDKLTNGESVYTIGKDNVIKKAFTETGKVDFKRDVVDDYGDEGNGISCAVLSDVNNHLVVGDEKGNIKVYDTRTKFNKLFQLSNVHDDMVNQIITIPSATSNYHFISVGSTTVAKIDIRKGVLLQSENQEDEVLSAVFPNVNSSESLICGMGSGVVTQWKEKKNGYADQLSRIKVSKDNSIDCLVSTMDEDDLDSCWASCADGILYKVNAKKSSILETRVHDELDEANMLDIDYDYRLISASMGSVKIWSNKIPPDVLNEAIKRASKDTHEDASYDSKADDSSDWSDMSKSDYDDLSSDSDNEPLQSAKRKSEKKESPINKKSKLDTSSISIDVKEKNENNPPETKNSISLSKKSLNSVKKKTEHGIMKFDDL